MAPLYGVEGRSISELGCQVQSLIALEILQNLFAFENLIPQ